MTTSMDFTFDGGMTVTDYKQQWKQAYDDAQQALKDLEGFNQAPTLFTFGRQFELLQTSVVDQGQIASLFVSLHPDQEMRDEGTTAKSLWDGLANQMNLSVPLGRLVGQIPAEDPAFDSLDRRFIEHCQQDVKRSGVLLPEEKRHELSALRTQLNSLRTEFRRNINDGERKWQATVEQLEGVPRDFLDNYPPDQDGKITLTTSIADNNMIRIFAIDDDTRKKAYIERDNVAWPINEPVLKQILSLSHQEARLLGYNDAAHYLCDKGLILKGASGVQDFVTNTLDLVHEQSVKEKMALAQAYGTTELRPWQGHQAKKKLSQQELGGFDVTQIRPYLRVENVLPAIPVLLEELFGIRFEARPGIAVWAETVKVYDVYDREDETLLGRLYTDLYLRSNKSSVAYVSSVIQSHPGHKLGEVVLVGNIPPAQTLMNFSELETIYHEYGHALHDLLASQNKYARFNGTSVEQDLVEAPSTFMEQHLLQMNVLERFARDDDGVVIPEELVRKLRKAQVFGRGMEIRYQLFNAEASLKYYQLDPGQLVKEGTDPIWKRVADKTDNHQHVEGTHPQVSFVHLVVAGYGPKYYCYVHSWVVAQDLFAAFQDLPDGIFDKKLCKAYKEMLKAGGSRDGGELLEQFLGRPSDGKAFQNWLSGL